ncbi:hypothetical protein [Klebsiella quasipneumoniae]|uniref:hypothetical protein n=1 Tax=Klebsiella quasipneumoniae TaxID=1463165 RepID=UPI002FE37E0E
MNEIQVIDTNISIVDDENKVVIDNSPELVDFLIKNRAGILETGLGDISIDDISVGPTGEIVFSNVDAQAIRETLQKKQAMGIGFGCTSNIGNCRKNDI